MNTGAMMEDKATKLMTISLTRPDKKSLKAVGAFVFLGFFVCTVIYVTSSDSPKQPNAIAQGSDKIDLQAPKPQTGCSVVGRVTINKQFPLGFGYVIAYDFSGTRALSSSPLDKNGRYKLENVTPAKLLLLVKREITDDPNPVFEGMVSQLGESNHHATNSPELKAKKSTMADMLKKKPPKTVLDAIRSDVSSPGLEALPEVRWMTQFAFLKFSHFSENHLLLVNAGPGERVYDMDLMVP